MMKLPKTENCIIAKSMTGVVKAKQNCLCNHIIYESHPNVYVLNRTGHKWETVLYKASGQVDNIDFMTTGLTAYREFYRYCGREEVDRMKSVYAPIPIWESNEQMHFCNIEYCMESIYKNIYEFDANSSFTYGTLQLPSEFDKLKEYMLSLYDYKKSAKNKLDRSTYKNKQNYLIGYFARVRELVAVRSEIIKYSNENILNKINEILKSGGDVFLSNTDSIVTDDIGADVISKYIGNNVGEFKLSTKTDRLYYNSSNSYQLGDKVVCSGVRYFARINTNYFSGVSAEQNGAFVKPINFIQEPTKEEYGKICSVTNDKVVVTVFNNIGELIDRKIYIL